MSSYPQSTWLRYSQRAFPTSVDAERIDVGSQLLDEFKTHVRVDHSHEDNAMVRYLNVAARALEDDTRRHLLTSTIKEYYDVWPWDYVNCVHLLRAPVVSITSIKYYDPDDVEQTWNSANYETDLINEPARIVEAEGATLTSPTIDQRMNAVTIEYECGYGATFASLNPETVNAILMKAGYYYEEARTTTSGGFVTGLADAVERCWQNEIRRLTWTVA